MIFFKDCILYTKDEDLIIHDVVCVKNAFRFSLTEEEYCKTVIDLLIKYVGYSIVDVNNELGLIITFVKTLNKDFNEECFELSIKLKEYCREMVLNEI